MLLDRTGLHGKTPTEVMDFPFRRLVERLMPENIQTILANSDITDCNELAKAAQKVYKPDGYGKHAVRKTVVPTPKKKVSTSSEEPSSPDDGYCFYHNTYGAKSRQCNPPCNFNSSKPSGNACAGRQ